MVLFFVPFLLCLLSQSLPSRCCRLVSFLQRLYVIVPTKGRRCSLLSSGWIFRLDDVPVSVERVQLLSMHLVL